MTRLSDLPLGQLLKKEGYPCSCGTCHRLKMDVVIIRSGAVRDMPQALRAMGGTRPFIVCDRHTRAAAWDRVRPVLEEAGIPYTLYCFSADHVEPDERTVGSLLMSFDPSCDCVMGIGSGVINDCCKVLAHAVGRKQMIVATAPSMDGYASNSSAMIRDGVKVTLYNAAPAAVICDTDILRNAPMRMLQAGLGDMLAKYVSLYEWKMSSLVAGEYYCENVAGLMHRGLQNAVRSARGLARRDENAVEAVTEGLVLSGMASSFAGVSRPASGMEHCFSHLWEMMCLERGLPFELHGIQVGIGTLLVLKLYEGIRTMTPDRETAEAFIGGFIDAEWAERMRAVFGGAAETIIRREHTAYHQNDRAAHALRLTRILENWETLRALMETDLPRAEEIASLMRELHMPMTPAEIGFGREDTEKAFIGSREIRNRYMTSSLLWDLGLLYTTPLPV